MNEGIDNSILDAYQAPGPPQSNFQMDDIKNKAVCIGEAALESDINSWDGEEDGLYPVILGFTGLDGDDMIGEEQIFHDALLTQIAHYFHHKGADYGEAQKSMIGENNEVFARVLAAARKTHLEDNREDCETIGEYLDLPCGTLYDVEEFGKIAEECIYGIGYLTPDKIGEVDAIGEMKIAKIVGGVKKLVKKKIGKKKKRSAKQKAALKKALRKSNTGAAKRNRKKSMKMRKKLGMSH